MFKLDLRDVVSHIVRSELVGKGRENEALYLNFDLRMSYYREGQEYYSSSGLHLLYHLRPDFASVSVFSGITSHPLAKIREVENWKHEGTHDSCWRNIDLFSTLYFAMAENINAKLEGDGFDSVAPADMNESNSFNSLFNGGKYFDWVPVKVSMDRSDENGYRRMIEVL